MSISSRLRALIPRADAVSAADVAEVREDAASGSGSSVSNFLSGLGGENDSGSAARPNVRRRYLDDDELVALMRGTVYRRIVELKPKWATMRGITVSDSTGEPKPLDRELRDLKVLSTVRRAAIWGRSLGEARILLVVEGGGPLDQPLDRDRVTRLVRLEVFDKRELTPVAWNTDVSEGPLGEPSVFTLHPRRRGVGLTGKRVHASRLLRFYGDELPPSSAGEEVNGWGADAIGQVLWDGLRDLAQTGAGGARLAQELSVAVFKVKPDSRMGDQREAALKRLQTLSWMKSVAQSVFLNTGEEFQRVAATPTGFADLSEHARLTLALLAGYPLPLLFGQAPGGLNSDGESWKTAWFADVAADQEDRYREAIETIVELVYCSHGAVPEQWSVEFNPLGELSQKELAEIRLLTTQADGAAILDGVLTPDEVRARYEVSGGYAFELPPVEARTTEAPGPSNPELEEEVQTMLEQVRQKQAEPSKPEEPSPEGAVGDDEVKPLNGAQMQAAQGILQDVGAGVITRESGRLLLEGIVPPERAVALIESVKAGASPAPSDREEGS